MDTAVGTLDAFGDGAETSAIMIKRRGILFNNLLGALGLAFI